MQIITKKCLTNIGQKKEVRMKYRKYKCIVCEYIYDEEKGDPESGLAPGTRLEDIPSDWQCPDCGVKKKFLELVES